MISGVLAKTEPATDVKEPPRGDSPTGGGGGSGAVGDDEPKPAASRTSRLTKILGGKRD